MALAVAINRSVSTAEAGESVRPARGLDPIKYVRRCQEVVVKFAAARKPITMRQVRAELGVGICAANEFLRSCRLITWATVTQVDGHFIFEIDSDLKDICELRRSQKSLGGRSIESFVGDLRKEITRRRKENNAQRSQRSWNVEAIVKLELLELLDWVEGELGKITAG